MSATKSINGIFNCWEKMALQIDTALPEEKPSIFNKNMTTFITKLDNFKMIIPYHPTWPIYVKTVGLDIDNINDENYINWFLLLSKFNRNI